MLQFVIFITQILPSTENVNKIPQLNSLPSSLSRLVGEKDAVHNTVRIKHHLKEKVDVSKITLKNEDTRISEADLEDMVSSTLKSLDINDDG
uniref:Uncharacterized protein n=1 Tax=Onchocerca volvulus TaxID=6282 RepID=A0A8R1XZL1_ONCVO